MLRRNKLCFAIYLFVLGPTSSGFQIDLAPGVAARMALVIRKRNAPKREAAGRDRVPRDTESAASVSCERSRLCFVHPAFTTLQLHPAYVHSRRLLWSQDQRELHLLRVQRCRFDFRVLLALSLQMWLQHLSGKSKSTKTILHLKH